MLKLGVEQFDALDATAAQMLAQRGFTVGKKERAVDFGSHSSQYDRGKERVTLYYDGRDNNVGVIYLEDATNPPRATRPILSMPLSRKFSSALNQLEAQLRERLHAI